MRILVLNQYFHPDTSATSQLLTELAEDLAAEHSVRVVCGRPSYNPTENVRVRGFVQVDRHQGVEVARVWSTSFNRASMLGRLTNYLTYVASSLVVAVTGPRPDVVMALTDPPVIGLVGAAASVARRTPLVFVSKDVFPEVAIALGRLDNPAAIGVLRLTRWVVTRVARRIVSIGSDMSRRLVEAGVEAQKLVIIHDWADAEAVPALQGASRLRREWGLEAKFVVMHSGNVGLSQALEHLLSAAERFRDRPEVVIAIVGEGADKERLQRLAAERGLTNVRFLPFQPKSALADSLGAADVHLVSLKRGVDGYIVPSKLYGILAAGRPFIAATAPWAVPALVAAETGAGVVVAQEDPEALAEAIDRLSREPLEGRAAAARRVFESRYTRRRSTGAYRELLESVAGLPQTG